MKVYIAAMYSLRDEVRNHHMEVLAAAGHEVTARWLWEDEPPGSEQANAVKDLADVARADAIVLVTNPIGTKYSGGGRHVEFGYALALGKHCFAVGEHETIFQHLPQVMVCSTIGAAVDQLALLQPSPSRARAMLNWCHRTFGAVALLRHERAARFVEEAIELAQAVGLNETTVGQTLRRVYSRRSGQIGQEIGQCQNLLECLAENLGLDAAEEGRVEFERCQRVPQEEWDRRHAAKVEAGTADVGRRHPGEDYYGENISDGRRQ